MRLPRFIFVAWVLFCGASGGADWPQFRGPAGDGHTAAKQLPLHWGGFDSVTWQAEIPGQGWSSPVVVGDSIWLTAAEATALPDRDRARSLAESPYRDYRDQLQVHASVTCYAVEIAAASGELRRVIELFTCEKPPPIHASNRYASPTPVSDGARLICHFGALGTAGLDLKTGAVLWQTRLLVDDITGPGSSPVLVGQLAIVPCDGADQQFVVALNTLTGKTAWKTARPPIDDSNPIHRRAFSTPLLIEHAGRQQVVVPGAQWVVAYDPATGAERWRVSFGDDHAIIPRPVYAGGLVYICTGYMKPQLWAIRVDGEGEVTASHVAWKYDKQVPEIASPVIVERRIYFVSSLGIATCLEAATGAPVWQHRLGGNYAASPLAADGKLYFTSREGMTTVLAPGAEYQELARNQLFGQTMASLAVAGEALLIRADRRLYCIGDPTPDE
jgi:outer membrane protein assembly factor BamB